MGGVNIMEFEKLEVWKRSSRLSVNIYKYLNQLRDFGFKDQITRAGLSVPSNIAEGMSRISLKEKLHFLNIASSSCSELRTQIYIGMEISYIESQVGKCWISETKELHKMLNGLRKKLQEN